MKNHCLHIYINIASASFMVQQRVLGASDPMTFMFSLDSYVIREDSWTPCSSSFALADREVVQRATNARVEAGAVPLLHMLVCTTRQMLGSDSF